MSPTPVTTESPAIIGGIADGKGIDGQCPIVNGGIIYPPVAPIPALRRSARGKSPSSLMRQNSKTSLHSLEKPDFIRPDLPSRCKWSPTTDKTKSPHTKDEP